MKNFFSSAIDAVKDHPKAVVAIAAIAAGVYIFVKMKGV